jgi:glycerol-3-phosphate responsive antiterminator
MSNDGIISKHLKAFSYGCLGGLSVSAKLFLLDASAWYLVAMDWIVRIVGVSIVTLVSGLISAAAADIYQHHIKPKILKDKKEKLPKNNSQDKAA